MCSDGLRAWNSKLGRWVSNIQPLIACIMPVLSRHCLPRCEHRATYLDEIWVSKGKIGAPSHCPPDSVAQSPAGGSANRCGLKRFLAACGGARGEGETGAPSHCPSDSVPQTPAGDFAPCTPLSPRLWGSAPCTPDFATAL